MKHRLKTEKQRATKTNIFKRAREKAALNLTYPAASHHLSLTLALQGETEGCEQRPSDTLYRSNFLIGSPCFYNARFSLPALCPGAEHLPEQRTAAALRLASLNGTARVSRSRSPRPGPFRRQVTTGSRAPPALRGVQGAGRAPAPAPGPAPPARARTRLGPRVRTEEEEEEEVEKGGRGRARPRPGPARRAPVRRQGASRRPRGSRRAEHHPPPPRFLPPRRAAAGKRCPAPAAAPRPPPPAAGASPAVVAADAARGSLRRLAAESRGAAGLGAAAARAPLRPLPPHGGGRAGWSEGRGAGGAGSEARAGRGGRGLSGGGSAGAAASASSLPAPPPGQRRCPGAVA